MERIEKRILIGVEAARVFDYVSDPKNLLEIWPSLVEVSNVEMKPDGRAAFDWTYKMAGLRFHGRTETIEVERPLRRVTRSAKGTPSTFEWNFEQRDHGTEVILRVEYEIPVPLLGHVAEMFLRHSNEREGDTLLANLKERLESAETTGRAATAAAAKQPPTSQPHH